MPYCTGQLEDQSWKFEQKYSCSLFLNSHKVEILLRQYVKFQKFLTYRLFVVTPN